MSQIKELPTSSSHLLSCTQIITTIHCVVKELLENAIDSSTKSVEIKLEDYGLDTIEVKDSGTGIHKEDISKVAKPHCTSKISSHLDLSRVLTYGFRGEALAALCAVSNLLITTKMAGEEFGYTYTFGQNGEIISSKPFPCTQGTTVTALNLFKNIPVRKQYYRTNKAKKEELKKIEDILIAFGCIHPGIRLALFHNRSLIWQKPTVSKIQEGLAAVLGNIVFEHLQECEFTDDKSQVSIEVFLPKSNSPSFCGSSSPNRSIVCINNRPVRMKAIDKVLKEYYNKSVQNFSKSRYPVCYISIKVPPSETDINIEPNKASVILHNMDIVIEQLTAILKNFYDNNSISEIKNELRATLTDANNKMSGCTENSNQNSIEKVSSQLPLRNSEICVISTPTQHLTPDLPFSQSKDKHISKKLSRQSNNIPTPPATKRIKSSNCSSVQPNDIYRHIKTINSFFESSEAVGLNRAELNQKTLLSKNNNPSDFETLISVTVPRDLESSANVSVVKDFFKSSDVAESTVNNSSSVEHFNVNHSSADKSVHATSKRDNLTQPASSEKTLNLTSVEAAGMSEVIENNNFTNERKGIYPINESYLSNSLCLNEMNNTRHVPENEECVINNENACPNLSDNLNFITAKSILENNESVVLNSPQQFSTLENLKTNAILSKQSSVTENQNLLFGSFDQDWSRGKHQIENLQPVTLLEPQAIKSATIIENSAKSKGNNEKRESCGVLPNQRKMSAFDFFCRKHRFEIAALNPEKNNHQIAQILTEKWNNLSLDEKAVYKNMIDKDYRKIVRKKDKLGKIVSQNLIKEKGVPVKPRKKIKKKCAERIIPFNVETVRNSTHSEDGILKDANVINCISPGIWIYCQKNKLYLLNTFRLQEIVIYHRLLETYKFQPEPLEFPCIVSSCSLGEEAMEIMTQMHAAGGYASDNILDDRITANGFEINILKGENEVQIQIVGMTRSIAFYGVQDLKEILKFFKEKGLNAKLSEIRPGKVTLYLQNEAVRMARQCPPFKKIDDAKDLLKKMKLLPNCEMCLHSKPVLHEISTLP